MVRSLMRLWRGLRRRWHGDRRMDEEFRAHIEMEAAFLAASGVDPAEARRRALIAFGGIERHREAVRDGRALAWVDDALRDLRHVGRQVRRAPAFALTIVLTLALGLGANAAVFSLVDGVLLQPLPFADPERLVVVAHGYKGELLQLQARAHTLDVSAIESVRPVTMTGHGDPIRLHGAAVLPDFFRILGVQPTIGRSFRSQDAGPGADRSVLLSHRLWVGTFGADPAIAGREVFLDGRPHRIAGVMPPGAAYASPAADLWVPLAIDPNASVVLWSTTVQLFARLRQGADLEDAQTEVRALWPTFRDRFPWKMPEDYGRAIDLVPIEQHLLGDVRAPLLLLLAAVAAVLIIVCANVANLMLVRASARSRELGIRAAIGAGRGRLVRQIVTEALGFSVLGAAAGLLVATSVVAALRPNLAGVLPRVDAIGVDARVVLVTVGAGVLAAIASALYPASRAWRSSPMAEGHARGATAGREQRGAARVLVGAQVAIAAVLVSVAALLVISVSRLLSVDPGFTADGLVLAAVAPPEHRYSTPASRRAFLDAVLERARSAPGVRQAAAGNTAPFGGSHGSVFIIRGRPDPASQSGDWPWADVRAVVSSGYLSALGVPILEGRTFTGGDRAGSTPVAVVSRSLAQRYWPGGDALGARITFPGPATWITIVGVVGDVKWTDLGGSPESALFLPMEQSAIGAFTLVLRTAPGAESAVVPHVRQLVTALDPDTPVSNIRAATAALDASAGRPRLLASLLASFAAAALLLGAVGVYGVLSYSVTRRTQELGVRMALGAARRDVVLLVLQQGVVLAGVGALVGAVGAAVTGRSIAGLLFGIQPSSPLVILGGPLLMMAVAVAAATIPALRAARVDPVVALRLDA